MNITSNIHENVTNFKEKAAFDKNFDMICREFIMGNQKAALFLIDGDSSAQVSTQIMRSFIEKKVEKNVILTAQDMESHHIPFVEIAEADTIEKSIYGLMVGSLVLFLDKIDKAFLIDAKSYPQRGTTEPEKDKVIRGSHDGFVEITIFNSALIRRRIRSEQLRMERFLVGEKSKSDVIVCYMEDKCDKKFLELVKEKIKNIKIEALTMNQETLSESMFPPKWYNPFPKVRYSERPDDTSAAILQGSVVIIIDNSSSAMILPAKFVDFLHDANDYYYPPVTASFYRIVKTILFLMSIVLTPIWMWLADNPEIVPKWLEVVKIQQEAQVPIIVQLLILEFALEVVRISTINTPISLCGALGIVGALLIGEFAVSSGWMSAESVFYMAFLAVALYASPNFEFGYAIKFFRMALLVLTAIFGLWGLIGGILAVIVFTACNKTLDGKGYFYPIIPFSFKELMGLLGRGKLRR